MNWMLALPEIELAGAAMLALLVGVFSRRGGYLLATGIVLAGFAGAAVLVAFGHAGVAYRGTVVADGFSRFTGILILSAAALTTVLSVDYNEREHVARFEFPVLLAFSTLGMLVMTQAENLMTAYLGLELQSFSIYILCAFSRERVRSAEAGLKYFVLGALASGLLLYGISLVSGCGGWREFASGGGGVGGAARVRPGLLVGLVFVIAGLVFKLSAAPFHMWTPDVYEGAPSSVTAFMSTAPKVAPFAALLRFLIDGAGHAGAQWQLIIEIVAIASMVVGSLAAIGQTSIKRLMAFSSIGHMGYALMGLAAADAVGVTGVLVYLLTYIFMNVGVFCCIMAMRRRGIAVERIADLSGLGRNDPLLAGLFALFLFSMAGLPPLAGFFGKLYVFLAALHQGLWVLLGVGVVTSVVSAFYYLRVVRVMWFDAPAPALDRRPASIDLVAWTAAGFTGLFILGLGPLAGAAATASRALFE